MKQFIYTLIAVFVFTASHLFAEVIITDLGSMGNGNCVYLVEVIQSDGTHAATTIRMACGSLPEGTFGYATLPPSSPVVRAISRLNGIRKADLNTVTVRSATRTSKLLVAEAPSGKAMMEIERNGIKKTVTIKGTCADAYQTFNSGGSIVVPGSGDEIFLINSAAGWSINWCRESGSYVVVEFLKNRAPSPSSSPTQ